MSDYAAVRANKKHIYLYGTNIKKKHIIVISTNIYKKNVIRLTTSRKYKHMQNIYKT